MTPAAATAYAYHQGVALSLLERVRTAMDSHAAAAAAKPRNWGYVGDVESAAGKLQEALAALDVVMPAASPTTGP